tara:strand:- start:199 stop:684 length:486 start_codon:yes stop_codon:yes gene_type:complete
VSILGFFGILSALTDLGEYMYEWIFLFFISLFFTILFLQSGIDKIIAFSGNLNYFKDHFKHTFLKSQVKLLLILITLLECITGLLFLFYLISLLMVGPDTGFLVWGMGLYFTALTCALFTLCSLFLGQRLAQDYVGAVNLGIYFLIALAGLAFPVLYLELS